MISEEKETEEYQNRYRFWTDKRISQLSFFNNLLLTIGIVMIGYIWSENTNFYINLINIKWNITLLFLALAFNGFSILTGLILAISRLYDLRLTSNIMLTRKRALKNDIKLDTISPEKESFLITLCSVIFKYNDYSISSNDINKEKLKILNYKFIKLRVLSNSLGIGTWKLLNYQIITFLFSIIFLFLSTLVN